MKSGKKIRAADGEERGAGGKASARRQAAPGPGSGPRSPGRALWFLGGAAALLLIAWGCAHFGIFGGRGPLPLTIVYSCDANGELKPCG